MSTIIIQAHEETEWLMCESESKSSIAEQAACKTKERRARKELAQQQRLAEEERERQTRTLHVQTTLQEYRQAEPQRVVKLNLSTVSFTVLRSVLVTREPESLLAELARDPKRPDEICLPRNGDLYVWILEWLQSGDIRRRVPFASYAELQKEASFLGLHQLVQRLKPFRRRLDQDDVLNQLSRCNQENYRTMWSFSDLSGLDLSGLCFGACNLEGASFVGCDLKGTDLSEAVLTGCRFSGCDLRNTRLPRNLMSCDFSGANLSGQALSNANLKGSVLTEVNLSGANCAQATLGEDCDLSSSDLTLCNLSGCDLESVLLPGVLNNTNLSGSKLILQDLSQCVLNNVDLSLCDLHEVCLPVDLSMCKLVGANLSGVDLRSRRLPLDLTNVVLVGASLPVDLRNFTLNGADLSGVDLRSFKLPKDLSRINFSNGNLTGVDTSESDLTGCVLSGAKMVFSKMQSNRDLRSMRFPAKDSLQGANVSRSNLTGQDLTGFDLSHTDLSNAILTNVTLCQANLTEVNLVGSNLSGANLSGLDLSSINFAGCDLSGANLSRANLSQAKNLREAQLIRVNFSHSNLSGMDLAGLDLTGCDLAGAELSQVRLTGANLSNSNLAGLNLSGFDLSRCNLSGANTVATELKDTNLSFSLAQLAQIPLDIVLDDAKLPESVILTLSLVQSLLKMFPAPKPAGFELLYRGTRDSCLSSVFHAKCDGKGPTITVIRSGRNVFGGFASTSWSIGPGYFSDKNAWLFSLVNSINSPKQLPILPSGVDYALFGSSYSWGPCFGQSSDICISEQWTDAYNYNYSSPMSYDFTGVPAPHDQFLAGSRSFKVDEIEVFAVKQ